MTWWYACVLLSFARWNFGRSHGTTSSRHVSWDRLRERKKTAEWLRKNFSYITLIFPPPSSFFLPIVFSVWYKTNRQKEKKGGGETSRHDVHRPPGSETFATVVFIILENAERISFLCNICNVYIRVMYVDREYNEYCYMIIKRKSFENTFHFYFSAGFRRLYALCVKRGGEGALLPRFLFTASLTTSLTPHF